jgi:N-acetyl-anhydromuramyl-L-alanine amidase AmpD
VPVPPRLSRLPERVSHLSSDPAAEQHPGAAAGAIRLGLRSLSLLSWLSLLVLLSSCGPRAVRAPFPVQTLADSGLKPMAPEALAACARLLALPHEQARPADPSNFGQRQPRDAFSRVVPNRPQLIVLHETVLSAADTVKLFATPHPRDDDQASYHLLIDRAGQRLRIVPDVGRAFGAGMAAFGDFTVRIRPRSVGSLNNVALHLSLESPLDGRGDGDAHSGYTAQQYRVTAGQVLLWQAAYGIPLSRITTHESVDRSHSRRDPRSFAWNAFDTAWRQAAERCGLTAYDRGRATL